MASWCLVNQEVQGSNPRTPGMGFAIFPCCLFIFFVLPLPCVGQQDGLIIFFLASVVGNRVLCVCVVHLQEIRGGIASFVSLCGLHLVV